MMTTTPQDNGQGRHTRWFTLYTEPPHDANRC